jgi:hypothetical protein
MFSLIGLAIVWVIGFFVIGFIVNTFRVQQGVTALNDGVTAFIQGMTFGPLGVISALAPQMRQSGKTMPMASGGVIGTLLFLEIYGNL